MMRKVAFSGLRAAYSTTGRRLAEPAAASSSAELVLNFVTPHAPIFNKKVVESVTLPGASGEYGLTKGHAPLISQLEPGLVTVYHVGGQAEKFFISGGFAVTQANSVTDVSVPEAVPLADIDESAVRNGYQAANQATSSHAEGTVAHATATIERNTYAAMARVLNIAL